MRVLPNLRVYQALIQRQREETDQHASLPVVSRLKTYRKYQPSDRLHRDVPAHRDPNVDARQPQQQAPEDPGHREGGVFEERSERVLFGVEARPHPGDPVERHHVRGVLAG